MFTVIAWVALAVVVLWVITRPPWDKRERRDSVIGSQLSPRAPVPPEDAP
jgi:hypothetical protein